MHIIYPKHSTSKQQKISNHRESNIKIYSRLLLCVPNDSQTSKENPNKFPHQFRGIKPIKIQRRTYLKRQSIQRSYKREVPIKKDTNRTVLQLRMAYLPATRRSTNPDSAEELEDMCCCSQLVVADNTNFCQYEKREEVGEILQAGGALEKKMGAGHHARSGSFEMP